MKQKIAGFTFIFILWYGLSLFIQREVILPMPFDVFKRMFDLVGTSGFYTNIIQTCIRVLISFFVSMILGITIGMLAGLSKKIYHFFMPIFIFIQSIPQVVYILLLLIWLRGDEAIIMMIFIMAFPIFYHNSVVGIRTIDQDMKDLIQIHNHRKIYLLFKIYLPLIQAQLISAIQTSLPLCFKVGIMAEVFVQTQAGIGSAIYYYRTNIDMISIFAWVGWLIIIILCFNYITNLICRRINK